MFLAGWGRRSLPDIIGILRGDNGVTWARRQNAFLKSRQGFRAFERFELHGVDHKQ
jgi:hypothetical protein